MTVTEDEYDRWPSDMWEDLSRGGSNKYTCSTCAHEGCCDGLPNCGGSCWQNAMSECPGCGKEFRDEGDWQSEDGHSFCSEECLDEWESEHKEQEDEQ